MASENKSADLIANRYGHLPYRQRVITPSTASTGIDLTEAESGAIFYIRRDNSTFQARLPRISSLRLGVNFSFVVKAPADADGFTIMCVTASSGQLIGVLTSNSTASTAQEAALATTEFDGFCKVTAVSSQDWLFEGGGQYEQDGGASAGDGNGYWTTGSTST